MFTTCRMKLSCKAQLKSWIRTYIKKELRTIKSWIRNLKREVLRVISSPKNGIQIEHPLQNATTTYNIIFTAKWYNRKIKYSSKLKALHKQLNYTDKEMIPPHPKPKHVKKNKICIVYEKQG